LLFRTLRHSAIYRVSRLSNGPQQGANLFGRTGKLS
jgi:hypothetical protein